MIEGCFVTAPFMLYKKIWYTDFKLQISVKQLFENKCDIDGLEILVFNNTILDTFTGKSIELPQYQQEYSESEFEVLTETYNWRRAVLQGWLWTEGNPVHCIMDIYFTGDMLYIIDESL